MFNIPAEDRYKLSEQQKRRWIDDTLQTVQQCVYEHAQKMKSGQKDIRKYFKKHGKKE